MGTWMRQKGSWASGSFLFLWLREFMLMAMSTELLGCGQGPGRIFPYSVTPDAGPGTVRKAGFI